MIRHSTCMSALMPMHKDRYVSFSWPEDIQPHEAEFMQELFALQIPAVHRIAAANVAKVAAEAEYDSWLRPTDTTGATK